MIKSYLLQLRELQEDRTSFEQQAHKNSQTVSLRRQEDKYQAYIIGQMASQNRIIAVSQIVSLLTGPIRTLQTDFFHTGLKPAKRTTEDKSVTSIGKIFSKKQCDESAQHSDSMTVDFMLVKMCSKLIIRYAEKSQLSVLQQSFSEIKEYSKRKLLMQKLSNNLSRYHWRVGLQAMRGIEKKHEHSCDTIFNDSFSMIAKQDRIKRPNAEESYMSFMVEKQNMNSDCLGCRDSCHLVLQKQKEGAKLREELSFLKHLLAEKTLELIKKQEEGRPASSELQHSTYTEQNSSYYSQLERQVFGGKRIRKNGSQIMESSQLHKDEISKELLGKYMRQSFQLKESMDVAIQLCLQLEESVPVNHRVQVQQVLKVLNRGEQVSLVDQY